MSHDETNTETATQAVAAAGAQEPTRPTSPTPSLETTITSNSIIIPATKADGTPVKIWMCAESREKRRLTQKAYREKKNKELKEKLQRLEQLEAIVNGVQTHNITAIYPQGEVEQYSFKLLEEDKPFLDFVKLSLEVMQEKNIIHSFKFD